MARLLDFAKIHAAGNDFIILDKDTYPELELTEKRIQKICDRHLGIGGDGIILVSCISENKIGMKYYNSNGCEGEMCGNGLRATVLFTYMLGLIKSDFWFTIEAVDGNHRAIFESPDQIKVEVKVHDQLSQISSKELNLSEGNNVWGFINTGVPHLVINVKSDLDTINVFELGRKLRNHLMFKKDGTNVNFVKIIEDNKLQVRTYERGVEAETLSCGTGVTATALSYWQQLNPNSDKVEIITRGGVLWVVKENDYYYLTGPAKMVFVGHYMLD